MYPGVILAGGSARRLGGNGKAFIDVAGVPLIQHTITALHGFKSLMQLQTEDGINVMVHLRQVEQE